MDPTPNRLLYRPEEVAEATGLSRTVVYRLLQTGDLDSVRIGRARRVPHGALEAFIERLQVTGGVELTPSA